LCADSTAREDGEKMHRKIVRANIRRGDVTVDLLSLSPAAKLAVAEALEVLRAEGGDPLDLPAAAREFAARHLAESRATLEEVLNRHLDDLRALGRSKATIRQREDLCRNLCKSVGGTRRIGAVGRPEIAEWVATATPGSRRAYYTAAAALFRWAWQRGYCQEYPMGALPKPGQPRTPEPAILKPEQVRKLFSETLRLASALVPYLALAVFAGLRQESELGHLQWEDIDMEDRRIYCLSLKTGRARPVPISDNHHAWLSMVPESRRTGKAAPFSRSAWRRIQAQAGVPVGHDVLRHTRVSYRLAVVKDPGIVAAEGGHTLSILQRHYANLRIKDAEAEAFWGIVPP
jgi:integrase